MGKKKEKERKTRHISYPPAHRLKRPPDHHLCNHHGKDQEKPLSMGTKWEKGRRWGQDMYMLNSRKGGGNLFI